MTTILRWLAGLPSSMKLLRFARS
ncbi:hypothetical protein LINGRAHAP2_LOCUS31045 [Linum grandiflorum]